MTILLDLAMFIALDIGTCIYTFRMSTSTSEAWSEKTTAILMGLIISALLIGFSIRKARRVYGVQRLRLEKKAQCQERIHRTWSSALAINLEDSTSIKAAKDELEAAAEQRELWASEQVIRQLAALRISRESSSKDHAVIISVMDSIIRIMQADLGQRNLTL